VDLVNSDSFASDAAYGNTGLTGRHQDHHHHASGGGIGGFFRRLFGSDQVDDRDEIRYSEAVRSGRVVVTVRGDENAITRAEEVFERHNPIDIDNESTWSSDRDTYAGEDRDRVVPVVEEQLHVSKRQEHSPVRIYSRTVETPVEQDVELVDERVRVERRPANRPATPGDFDRHDTVIEVNETIEEPVVEKEQRVVEDVVVDKKAVRRKETIRDTVRHTEVNVDPADRDLRKKK
jgi:stress response protein YsnF